MEDGTLIYLLRTGYQANFNGKMQAQGSNICMRLQECGICIEVVHMEGKEKTYVSM